MNHQVNDQITAATVLVVLQDGTMHGEMGLVGALQLAQKYNLDLIQVSSGDIPVCKISDYGVIKYKNKKKKRGSKHVPTLKQIRVSYGISDHDLKTKRTHAISLLKKKHKIKYILRLKGREKSLREESINKMKVIADSFNEYADNGGISVSSESSSMSISMMLTPKL